MEVLYEMLGDIYIKAGRMKLALETYRILGKDKKDDGESLYRFAERLKAINFSDVADMLDRFNDYMRMHNAPGNIYDKGRKIFETWGEQNGYYEWMEKNK